MYPDKEPGTWQEELDNHFFNLSLSFEHSTPDSTTFHSLYNHSPTLLNLDITWLALLTMAHVLTFVSATVEHLLTLSSAPQCR